jgi:hypothetical protein
VPNVKSQLKLWAARARFAPSFALGFALANARRHF